MFDETRTEDEVELTISERERLCHIHVAEGNVRQFFCENVRLIYVRSNETKRCSVKHLRVPTTSGAQLQHVRLLDVDSAFRQL